MRNGAAFIVAILLTTSCAVTVQNTQADGDVADGGAADAIGAPDGV